MDKSYMDIFIKIGQELSNSKEYYEKLDKLCKMDHFELKQMLDSIIEICLLNNIDCQELINIYHNDCKKECLLIL